MDENSKDLSPIPTIQTPKNGRRFPVVTLCVLSFTTAVTIMQFRDPSLMDQLGRRPGALAAGEWWRLVTPLFVHSEGWRHLLVNLLWIGFAGIVAEKIFGRWRWFILYFVPGVIGEWISFAWKPTGGGSSLGGCGLVGGICAWLLFRGQSRSWALRLWGPAGLLAGLYLTVHSENHGPPLLAGAFLAVTFLLGRRPTATTEE